MDFNILKRSRDMSQGLGPDEEMQSETSGDFTQDYMPAKDPSELKDDELRQTYLSDKWSKDQKKLDADLESTKKQQGWAGAADVAGQGLADIGNAQRKDVMLYNRMGDLGKAQTIIKPEQMKWNKVQPAFDRQVDLANEAKKSSFTALKDGMAAGDFRDKEIAGDSNSPVSKQALLMYQTKLLAKAAEADAAKDPKSAEAIRDLARKASGLSSEQIKTGIGDLKDFDWKDIINNNNADKRLQMQLTAQGNTEDKAVKRADKVTANQDRDTTLKLSERYSLDPTTKATADVRTSVAKAEELVKNPSPNNDIALIFNLMKANDPGSTVREGEFALAAKSGSLGDKIGAWFSQAESGQLTPAKRQELLQTIRLQSQAQEDRQSQVDTYYSDLSKKFNADPTLVVGAKRSTAGDVSLQKNSSGSVSHGAVGHGSNLPPLGGK